VIQDDLQPLLDRYANVNAAVDSHEFTEFLGEVFKVFGDAIYKLETRLDAIARPVSVPKGDGS
jgi:hypothetical protein